MRIPNELYDDAQLLNCQKWKWGTALQSIKYTSIQHHNSATCWRQNRKLLFVSYCRKKRRYKCVSSHWFVKIHCQPMSTDMDALANPMALLLWMPLDSNHLLFHAPRLHKLSKTSIKQSALILSVAVWLSASCYIPAGHPLVFYFVFHTSRGIQSGIITPLLCLCVQRRRWH